VVRPTEGIPWILQEFPMVHARGAHRQAVKRMAEEIVASLAGGARKGRGGEPTSPETQAADV
jgi:hypothetical protein